MTLRQIPNTGWATGELRNHRAAGAICQGMKDTIKVSHIANYCVPFAPCQENYPFG